MPPTDKTSYIYPSNLTNKEYKYRKVTISVRKSEQQSNMGASATDAVNLYNDYLSGIKSKAESYMDMHSNIKANKNAHRKDLTVLTISLPLPNSFSDSQDHQWDEEVGLFGTIAGNAMKTSVSDIGKKLKESKKGGAISNVVGSLAEKIGGDISIDKSIGAMASHAGTRKPLVDPGYFQNYMGSTPRQFQMEWDLIPNNVEEAKEIMNIIMKLKQFASPTSIASGVSILAPYFLDVEISNKYLTSMIKLDRSVITNISVDYGADGAMQQTADGMPKYIKLSLALKEVDMTVSSDYDTIPNKA